MASPTQSTEAPYDTPYEQMALERQEHRSSGQSGFKAVIPYGWDETAAAPTPIPTPLIDQAYDSINMTNADGNGNYQTLTFKSAGTTVRTLTLAFDGSNNVTSIART